jgi:hypothetical protein
MDATARDRGPATNPNPEERQRLYELYRRLADTKGEKLEHEIRALELSFRTFHANIVVLFEPVRWFENTIINR